MGSNVRRWIPFVDQLVTDLDGIEADLHALIDISTIVYVNPNSGGSGAFFVMAADWGWGPTDEAQSLARMALVRRYRGWWERLSTLLQGLPHEVAEPVREADSLIRRWTERDGGWDHDIPRTIAEAKVVATNHVNMLSDTLQLLAKRGEGGIHVVPDTSALMRQPDLATYSAAVGADALTIHLVPTVLAEIDLLKDQGRTPEVRDKAAALAKRIKGLRDRGSLIDGVTVEGRVRAVAETRNADFKHLPDWLDPNTPDDQVLGAALALQAAHPSSVVVLAAADMNIQNKAEACGLPYVDPAP